MTKIVKSKIAQWTGTILAIFSLLGISWGVVIKPQIKEISRGEVELCVGKKFDIIIIKVDEIGKNQIATDLKVESLNGEFKGLRLFFTERR